MSQERREELLVFEVSGHSFSVPLSIVEEVVPAGHVTRVPDSPPFLLGLSGVRGKVMGVIDAARRYGFSPGSATQFLVCQVRGNVTAIVVDRAVLAGVVTYRELDQFERELLRSRSGIDSKFVRGGFEVLEVINEEGHTKPTGLLCLTVDADLFVSAEMASRVAEVA